MSRLVHRRQIGDFDVHGGAHTERRGGSAFFIIESYCKETPRIGSRRVRFCRPNTISPDSFQCVGFCRLTLISRKRIETGATILLRKILPYGKPRLTSELQVAFLEVNGPIA